MTSVWYGNAYIWVKSDSDEPVLPKGEHSSNHSFGKKKSKKIAQCREQLITILGKHGKLQQQNPNETAPKGNSINSLLSVCFLLCSTD